LGRVGEAVTEGRVSEEGGGERGGARVEEGGVAKGGGGMGKGEGLCRRREGWGDG